MSKIMMTSAAEQRLQRDILVEECRILIVRDEISNSVHNLPTNKRTNALEVVFSALVEKSLNPQWVTGRDCLSRENTGNDVYVVSKFSGDVFAHLSRLRSKVYGPLVILSCLSKITPLPKSVFPLWSLALQGAVVCFSGFDREIRVERGKKVRWMGGSVMQNFSSNVTHLVAFSYRTASMKISVAKERMVPILTMEWIADAWKSGNTMSYLQRRKIDTYKLKIFAGLVITCSGMEVDERKRIAQAVARFGGKFSGYMKKQECTHLLICRPFGMKYDVARSWGWDSIKIVHKRWLGHCIRKETILSEDEFKVVDSTRVNNMGYNDSFYCNWNDYLAEKTSDALTTSKDIDYKPFERCPSNQSRDRCGVSTKDDVSCEQLDPVAALFAESTDLEDLMEGMKFFICGFSKENQMKWRKIIHAQGACIFYDLTEHVTHVIVGPLSLGSELVSKLSVIRETVPVLRAEWLTDSIRQKCVADTSLYHYSVVSNNVPLGHLCQTAREISQSNVKENVVSHGSIDEKNQSVSKLSDCIYQDNNDISSKIFQKLTFRVSDVDRYYSSDIYETIKNHAGRSMKSPDVKVNYLVFPLLQYGPFLSESVLMCEKVVTNFWLHACINQKRVLPTNSHPMFTPLHAVRGSKIFSDVIFALCFASKLELAAFSIIISSFGGRFHYRELTESKLVETNVTLMVSSEESSKTECALSLGIPVVHRGWIIESIAKDEVLATEPFLFDATCSNIYQRTDEIWQNLHFGPSQQCSQLTLTASPTSKSQRSENLPVDRGCGHDMNYEVSKWIHSSINEQRQDFYSDEKLENSAESVRSGNLDGHSSSDADFKPSGTSAFSAADILQTAQPLIAMKLRDSDGDSSNRRVCEYPELLSYPFSEECLNDLPRVVADPNSLWSDTSVQRALDRAVIKTGLKDSCSKAAKTVGSEVESHGQRAEKLEFDNINESTIRTGKSNIGSKENVSGCSYCIRESSDPVERAEDVDASCMRGQHQITPDENSYLCNSTSMIFKGILGTEFQYHKDDNSYISRQSSLVDEQRVKRTSTKRKATCDQHVTALITTSDGEGRVKAVGWKKLKIDERGPNIGSIEWDGHAVPNEEEIKKFDEFLSIKMVKPSVFKVLSENKSSVQADELENPLEIVGSSRHVHRNDNETPSKTDIAGISRSVIEKIDDDRSPKKDSVFEKVVVDEVREVPYSNPSNVINILFSTMGDFDRSTLTCMVRQLGGVTWNQFDAAVDYLVCKNIVRNEKLLSCIASGLYILRLEYVIDSFRNKRWLNPADYEWGYSTFLAVHKFTSERMRLLAVSAKSWRIAIQKTPFLKAFHKWSVVLYCNRTRCIEIQRIVCNGGGTVFHRDEICSIQDGYYTHALIEKSQFWTKEEISYYVKKGIPCFNISYVADFLMSKDRDEREFLHKDYLKQLEEQQ